MFQIGDKVFYPMLGVGFIEAIEAKEIQENDQLCYTLNIPQIKMRIMIPIENVRNFGIRQIVEPDILENILTHFNLESTDPVIYENQRCCTDINKNKLKTGNIYKETEIIRDLMRKSQRHKLGEEDKTMLNSARRMFISEVMQVNGMDQEQADHLLVEVLLTAR